MARKQICGNHDFQSNREKDKTLTKINAGFDCVDSSIKSNNKFATQKKKNNKTESQTIFHFFNFRFLVSRVCLKIEMSAFDSGPKWLDTGKCCKSSLRSQTMNWYLKETHEIGSTTTKKKKICWLRVIVILNGETNVGTHNVLARNTMKNCNDFQIWKVYGVY